MEPRQYAADASGTPPPVPASPSNGYPTSSNPSTGTKATKPGPYWYYMIGESMRKVLVRAGIIPDANNLDLFGNAIQAMIEARVGDYALDTGAVNAYVIALNPAITAYTGNFNFSFKAAHTGTGAGTIDFGAGAVPLVNDVGGALADGDIQAGMIVSGEYSFADGKAFINSLVQSQMDVRYARAGTGKTVGEPFWHFGNSAPPCAMVIPLAATSISRTAYPELNTFCAGLGYPWGAGDGATTFGMPYLPADQTLVQGSGNLRTYTLGQLLNHVHAGVLIGMSGNNGGTGPGTAEIPSGGNTASVGGSANLAAGLRTLLCIQYKSA